MALVKCEQGWKKRVQDDLVDGHTHIFEFGGFLPLIDMGRSELWHTFWHLKAPTIFLKIAAWLYLLDTPLVLKQD